MCVGAHMRPLRLAKSRPRQYHSVTIHTLRRENCYAQPMAP